mmetsp:Transcript_12615/g.12695  ORF Transcript_12615/g.12695 Transcript_12615/m.12695 type:complete len:145 (-) Transcript_12615:31-465(-)
MAENQSSDYIPPVPTREQELKYLDDLEWDLRNRKFRHRNYAPDPSRHYLQDYDDRITKYRFGYWSKFLLGSILAIPVATWLTNKSPAKKSFMNIPYRTYPYQQNFRFWTFFITYDLLLAYTFAHFLKDKKYFEPLLELQRERKL